MSPAEQAEWEAIVACSARAEASFPIMKEIPDVEDEKSDGGFELGPGGKFVMTMSARGKGRPLTDRLSCVGDMTQRTIQSVEFNGVIKRPADQEVWKY